MYMILKHTHLLLAVISISGFIARGLGHLVQAQWVNNKPARILPHIIDTLFLGSAIALMILIQQYPFVHHWLTAKIAGLIVYIILGTMALKHADSVRGRIGWMVLAFGVFAYVVSVALTRSAAGFLGNLF